jgi:hypothetical protein
MWVVLPVALIYGFIQIMYPTCSFRYRLTAEVMTPKGLKTGSSVIEVSYSSLHPIPNPGRWSYDRVTGEAVYVDLGGGKNLFVLLGADKWERRASRTPGRQGGLNYEQMGEGSLNVLWLPVYIYKLGRFPGDEREMQSRVNAIRNSPAVEVPLANIPLLSSFEDMAKQETFNTVPPNDIGKVLGDGYVLKRVTIQVVDEELASKMKALLPWLPTNETAPLLAECRGQSGANKTHCRTRSGGFSLFKNPHIGMF